MYQTIARPAVSDSWIGGSRAAETPQLPLFALLAFVVVLILRPSDWLPALAPLRPAMLTFVAALGGWLLSGRPTLILHHRTNRFALGLLAMAALSIPFSYWPSKSLDMTIVCCKQVTAFVLIINVMTSISAVTKLVAVMITAHAVHAAFAVRAFLTGEVYLGRAFGTVGGIFGDPNDLALSFVIMWPVTLWMWHRAHRWWGRVLWMVLLVLLLFGIVATQSRGGFLGALVVVAISLKDSSRRWLAVLTAVMVGIGILIAAPPGAFERYRSITEYQNDASSQLRLHLWKTGLQMWAEHPITGVGAGAFETAYGAKYLSPVARVKMWRTAHNSAVQVAAELGTLGIALWIGMIAAAFGALRSARQLLRPWSEIDAEADDLHRLCATVRTALIGYLVCAMFLSRAYDWLLMILLALCVSCWLLARHREAPRSAVEPPDDEAVAYGNLR